jgi:acetyl-CoA C-acetyltransferase
MLERVANDAAVDAGAGPRALRELDAIGMVDVVGWRPHNGPRLLAERVGAKPVREVVSGIGGEIPLRVVNAFAREIAAGRSRVALVAGAHAVRTLRRAQGAHAKLQWAKGGNGEPERIGENRRGSSRAEAEYGLNLPIDVYPIFENALRAKRGLDLATHRRRVSELMSRFTKVAARHPIAWYPVERSPAQIGDVAPDNRMVAYPYTKFMNAVMETDQAAAILMTSAAAARDLGVPEQRMVHWWGGAYAQEEAWYPSERLDFAVCPALREAVGGALDEAALSVDEVDHFDFYSCFPVAVEMACEMLGLAEDDPRGLTVTGGLPYFGGPGNEYTLHALATMVEGVRSTPGTKGLVTGNGWYLTKHAATVVASGPRDGGLPAQRREDEGVVPETTASTESAEGDATLETYTVVFDREGAPLRGIVLGRTDEGRRFVANTPEDRLLLEAFVAAEEVGRRGRVSHRDGRNLFDPA